MKNLNSYYIGFCFIIVLIQLIIPENIENTYPYIFFVLGFLLINLIYIVIKIKLQNYSTRKSNRIFETSDISLLTFSLNIISIATLLYFFYIHTIILSNSVEIPSEYESKEYLYRNISYYMTEKEYGVLQFWKYAPAIIIPLSIAVNIFAGFTRRRDTAENNS